MMVIAVLVPMIVAPVVMRLVTVTVTAEMVAIVRDVDVAIPRVADEVDRAVAGAVLAAITLPVAFLTGRYVQIDGRRERTLPRPCDDHRVGEDQLRRRCATDIDLAEESRLAEAYRHAYIGGMGPGRDAGEQRHDQQRSAD
jgi:hypothetical protein